MPKRKRRRPATPAAEPKWNWISFPVFFAFSLGLLLASLLFGLGYAGWVVAFSIGLFGLSFGIAHMLTRPIARRRSQRAQDEQQQQQR